jgi:hypothetical protein
MLTHLKETVDTIRGRCSRTGSGQKARFTKVFFSEEFIEFFNCLKSNKLRTYITDTCNVTFSKERDTVYFQVAEGKNVTVMSHVDFTELPTLYSHQLDTPWSHIDHGGNKKRKAAHVSLEGNEDQQEAHEDDMQEINAFNTPPTSPLRPAAVSKEGLGKMKGRSSRAERKQAHDILTYLKQKVVEQDMEDESDEEGPAKLKRLLKKCLHKLDALPSEQELLAKAKEAVAYTWILKALKSHVKFRMNEGLKVKDRDKIILAASTISAKQLAEGSENMPEEIHRYIVNTILDLNAARFFERERRYADRKKRRDKIDLEFVSTWLHDEGCRLDTFSSKRNCYNPYTKLMEQHKVHEKRGTWGYLYTREFLRSRAYIEHLKKNPGQTISLSTFRKARCKCMKNATFHVCADEVETEMNELLESANKLRNRHMYKCTCDHCMAFKAGNKDATHPFTNLYAFLDFMFCAHGTFPDEAVNRPMLNYVCCFGQCNVCKQRNSAGVRSSTHPFSCTTIFSVDRPARWRYYETLDNGKFKTKELRYTLHTTGEDLLKAILKHLAKYAKHYWTYRWLDFVRECGRTYLPRDWLYIQTDFAAQVDLSAQHTPTAGHSSRCNLSCWAIVYQLDGKDVCDHARIVSPATGKQKDQDWFMHSHIFREIINYYKNLLNVTNVIIWTDGAVGQYKCRQNFYSVATQFEDVKVTHKFAATSQFKGVHDKIGQVAKHAVQQAEKASLEHARCSTAWEWYCCCRDEMSKPANELANDGSVELLLQRAQQQAEQEVEQAVEQSGDNATEVKKIQVKKRKRRATPAPKLEPEKKKILKAQNYLWMYCASDQADMDKCKADVDRYKPAVDKILLLDRSQKWDCNAIPRSRSHYEFRNGFNKEEKDGPFNLFVRKYPCACSKCRESKFTECQWQEYHTGSFQGHTLTAKRVVADRSTDKSDSDENEDGAMNA